MFLTLFLAILYLVNAQDGIHIKRRELEEWVVAIDGESDFDKLAKHLIVKEKKVIGGYTLLVLEGRESHVSSVLMNSDVNHLVFTKNAKISAGPNDGLDFTTGSKKRSLCSDLFHYDICKNMNKLTKETKKACETCLYGDKEKEEGWFDKVKRGAKFVVKEARKVFDDARAKRFLSQNQGARLPWSIKRQEKSVEEKKESIPSTSLQSIQLDRNWLKGEARVCRIQPSYGRVGFEPGYFSWGVDRTDQVHNLLDRRFCHDKTGSDVHIYVMDTGVHPHKSFRHNVTEDFDYYNSHVEDPYGHGTHVACLVGSEIYGIAPEVHVHSLRVLNENGGGDFGSLTAGFLWLLNDLEVEKQQNTGRRKRRIINLSLGARGASSNAISNIIKTLVEDYNVVVIASAGNNAEDACNTFPAMLGDVITVASSNYQDELSYYSNRGSCVDFISPGETMVSCLNANDGGRVLSGTSMSAPVITGIVALILENFENATVVEVREILKQQSIEGKIQLQTTSTTKNLFPTVLDPSFNDGLVGSDPRQTSSGVQTTELLPVVILMSVLFFVLWM